MVDYIKVKQFIPYEFLNLNKWKKYRHKNKESGEITEGLITFIGKLKITYSFLSEYMYIQGRIISAVQKSNYLNFDDFDNPDILTEKCFNKINTKLNRLFINNFTVDISKMHVTQIEYSVNVNTQYKSEYIKLLNLIYIENKDKKYKRYLNYTVEVGLDLDSSFYLKTKADFLKNRKTNFCLDIYDKQKQLIEKIHNNLNHNYKPHITTDDIINSKDILRIECKAYYEYINILCQTFKTTNNLKNLFNIEISKYAIIHKLEYIFGNGDFYSKSAVEAKLDIKDDFNTSFSELTDFKAKSRKKQFKKFDICPYGFIPEDWNIDILKNPIKLIMEKSKK